MQNYIIKFLTSKKKNKQINEEANLSKEWVNETET